MDELSRIHKDAPFGWVQWLADLFKARPRPFEMTGWREPRPSPGELPSDFHSLSAPH